MTWALVGQIVVLAFVLTICVTVVVEKWPRNQQTHHHYYGAAPDAGEK